MNKGLRNTLIGIAVVVVAAGVFFSGYAAAGPFVGGNTGMRNGTGREAESGPVYGPGMRGGQGGYGMGPGMMDRYSNNEPVTPLTLEEAKTSAETYLSALGNPDLVISEIMIFDNNAYVVVTEAGTGLGAFELLVDPVSKVAAPEHGPNMMWNLKYGALNHQQMMGGRGGMRGGCGLSGEPSTDLSAVMTISPEQAVEIAQESLDGWLPGATAAADPVQFYGYYTLDYEVDGVVAGMLSVHGTSGQVFVHTWHGTFVEEQEY